MAKRIKCYDWSKKTFPNNPTSKFVVYWNKIRQNIGLEALLCCFENRLCALEKGIVNDRILERQPISYYGDDNPNNLTASLEDGYVYMLEVHILAQPIPSPANAGADALSASIQMHYVPNYGTYEWEYLTADAPENASAPQEGEPTNTFFTLSGSNTDLNTVHWSFVPFAAPNPVPPSGHTSVGIKLDITDGSYECTGWISVTHKIKYVEG